jgi:hypothetical protein
MLRVVTTFSPAVAAGLSHSGQQSNPISIASSNSPSNAGYASPSDVLMGMDIDQEESVAGYVFGMGGMGRDFATLSTPV